MSFFFSCEIVLAWKSIMASRRLDVFFVNKLILFFCSFIIFVCCLRTPIKQLTLNLSLRSSLLKTFTSIKYSHSSNSVAYTNVLKNGVIITNYHATVVKAVRPMKCLSQTVSFSVMIFTQAIRTLLGLLYWVMKSRLLQYREDVYGLGSRLGAFGCVARTML